MLSTKRKAAGVDLQRRVRARVDSDEEIEGGVESVSSGGETDSQADKSGESESDSASSDQDDDDEEEEEDLANPTGSISFGALAKAHATLTQPSSSKKRNSKLSTNDDGWDNKEQAERKAGRKDKRDFSRPSKHAPTEISSKKAVSRKREVVPVTKRQVRDPRFEAISGMVDEGKVRRAYGFLDDYREDEMKELRVAIKGAKDEEVKERLKRELLSMESRKKAQMRKDKADEVLDKHRKEEKELVKQGKQPFYLKKSEQKKRVLVEQYGGLKGKQLDHVMERRRKKVEGKEKKNMPYKRRGAEE